MIRRHGVEVSGFDLGIGRIIGWLQKEIGSAALVSDFMKREIVEWSNFSKLNRRCDGCLRLQQMAVVGRVIFYV